MAEEVKVEKDPFVEIVWWIAGIASAIFILNAVIVYLVSDIAAWEKVIIEIIFTTVKVWEILSVIISLILLVILVDVYRKLVKFRENELKLLYPEVQTAPSSVNPRWDHVIALSEASNPNDWRQAILEADILLAELLDTMFLPGDTVADKLKAVNKAEFLSIDNAWEAHKVRNQIAHEGSQFPLSQHEAKRVIALYKSVFEEFKTI